MKDVIIVFSAVTNLDIHSRMFINNIMKRFNDDYGKIEDILHSYNENTTLNNHNTTAINHKKNGYNECDKEDTDLIRFNNNGPKCSFIDEQCSEEYRTDDGTVFLNYMGNDVYSYYEIVDFDALEYEDQLELLELFEICVLMILVE
ncbi:hypothetical protein WA158_007061 [Blastocystis sp. Blastoise]